MTRNSGAPFRLSDVMPSCHFESILGRLSYTGREPPAHKDRFWKILDLVEAWNRNMDKVFSLLWVSCLDESMSIWFNK